MRSFTHLEILETYKSKGYPLNSGINEVNIFSIRNDDPIANSFDDSIGILTRVTPSSWYVYQWDATTDPGLYYRNNPMNKDGTAIVIPAFHPKCHKVGLHKGYEAMEQVGPMKYVRDNNKNGVLDFLYKITGAKIFNQIGKTNIHKAGKASKLVDKWSAGCQVFAVENDFNLFMTIVKKSASFKKANLFDYALFELKDIKVS